MKVKLSFCISLQGRHFFFGDHPYLESTTLLCDRAFCSWATFFHKLGKEIFFNEIQSFRFCVVGWWLCVGGWAIIGRLK